MIIDNVRLPQHLEQGARIGPTFSTSIISVSSGSEEANQNWQDELLEIDAAYGIMDQRSPDDIEDSYASILEFFRARRGRARGFLFRDPTDSYGEHERLYKIPGTEADYQLAKSYEDYIRRITRPDFDTLELFVGLDPVPEANWALINKGVVRLFNNQSAVNLNATFAFDIPVRFTMDKLQAQITHIRAGQVPDITLIQVRE